MVAIIVPVPAQIDTVAGCVLQRSQDATAMGHERHTLQRRVVELIEEIGDPGAHLRRLLTRCNFTQRLDNGRRQSDQLPNHRCCRNSAGERRRKQTFNTTITQPVPCLHRLFLTAQRQWRPWHHRIGQSGRAIRCGMSDQKQFIQHTEHCTRLW